MPSEKNKARAIRTGKINLKPQTVLRRNPGKVTASRASICSAIIGPLFEPHERTQWRVPNVVITSEDRQMLDLVYGDDLEWRERLDEPPAEQVKIKARLARLHMCLSPPELVSIDAKLVEGMQGDYEKHYGQKFEEFGKWHEYKLVDKVNHGVPQYARCRVNYIYTIELL